MFNNNNIKVKIIKASSPEEMEVLIEGFLKDKVVLNIDFSITENCYCALILYKTIKQLNEDLDKSLKEILPDFTPSINMS